MSDNIEILKNITISSIEKYYNKYFDDITSIKSIRLPSAITQSHIGGLAALIQLIITWHRYSDLGLLNTYAKSESDDIYIDRFSEHIHGAIASTLAKSIISLNGSDITKKMKGKCEVILTGNSELGSENTHGNNLWFISVDHLIDFLNASLYYTNGLIKEEGDFIYLTKKIMNFQSTSYTKRNLVTFPYEELARIIFELFKNTDEHARSNGIGVPYKTGVRGILSARHNLDKNLLIKCTDGCPPLRKYVSDFQSTNPNYKFRFFEISIFDSGPGLAMKMLGSSSDLNSITLEAEYEETIKCLRKYSSTVIDPLKGKGLHWVMRLLSKNRGFIRIRTGRLSLYRDFLEWPFNENHMPKLKDWANESEVISKNVQVSGTLLTLLFPERYLNE